MTTLATLPAGDADTALIAVVGGNLYINEGTNTKLCPLPTLNNCTDLGDVFNGVVGGQLLVNGSVIYKIGTAPNKQATVPNSFIANGTTINNMRQVQAFDTAAPTQLAVFLPPVYAATVPFTAGATTTSGLLPSSLALVDGKIYISSVYSNHKGLEIYTP